MLEKINEILIDITDTQRYLILVADTESSKNAKINFLKLVIKENKKITKNCEMLVKELEDERKKTNDIESR